MLHHIALYHITEKKSITALLRKANPLNDWLNMDKVFEDSKETFPKKFLWRGVGQSPTYSLYTTKKSLTLQDRSAARSGSRVISG